MGALGHLSKRRKLNPIKSARQTSALETLPVEILEQIFLESQNPRLLCVSSHIRQRLSSEYVRKEIILRCFHANGLCEDESLYTELQPMSGREKTASNVFGEEAPCPCPIAFGNLCALLDEDWVTMKLVKSVIVDWMWQIASSELHSYIREYGYPESDLQVALPILRERLDKCTNNMAKADIDFFETNDWGPSGLYYADTESPVTLGLPDMAKIAECTAHCPWTFIWPPTGPQRLRIGFLENGFVGKTSLGYVDCTVANRSSSGHWQPARSVTKQFVTWRTDHRLLPPRLLRGPWTQDRGDLLKFLLDQCDDHDTLFQRGLSPEQKAAADAGISQALLEGNQLAAFTLLGRCSSACAPLCTQFVLENCFASDFEAPCVALQSRGADAWKRLSWTRELMPSLSVDLTTEHVRECMDGFDDHPAASLQILGHLGHPSTKLPELPPGFMAKFKRRVEGQWDMDDHCMALIAEAMSSLYKEYVANGMGLKRVGFTNMASARTMGASVSVYASHANASGSMFSPH